MGHDGQSAAGIVGDVAGESFGHRVVEGNLVVEFGGEEGDGVQIRIVMIILSPILSASGFE